MKLIILSLRWLNIWFVSITGFVSRHATGINSANMTYQRDELKKSRNVFDMDTHLSIYSK